MDTLNYLKSIDKDYSDSSEGRTMLTLFVTAIFSMGFGIVLGMSIYKYFVLED